MKILLCAAMLVASIPAMAAEFFLYAGSYTAGTSKGIYAWKFDSTSGALAPMGLMAQTPQPAHLWISANGKFLYTVNWEKEGGVSAYRIDGKSGALTFLNRVSSHGAQPNQVVLDPSGRIAVTVNYTSGTMAAYKVESDGRLSEAFYVAQHSGQPLSPHQPGPKAHGIDFSQDGKWMFVAELGLDRVYSYRVDAAKPALTPHTIPFVNTHASAGPRRLQVSPDGRFLYVDHETDSEVSVFSVTDGALKEVQTISTLPAGTEIRNTTAEILISGDGRHLYVTNRGHDSIAVFSVDRATGLLTRSKNIPSGGRTPRNIRLSPDGDYLFAANENGGNVTEFRVDKTNGDLTPAGVAVPIDTPGGMYFLKVR